MGSARSFALYARMLSIPAGPISTCPRCELPSSANDSQHRLLSHDVPELGHRLGASRGRLRYCQPSAERRLPGEGLGVRHPYSVSHRADPSTCSSSAPDEWWGVRDSNPSHQLPLFHSQRCYRPPGRHAPCWCSPWASNPDSPVFKTGPLPLGLGERCWCHGRDSNPHCPRLERGASYRWATVALLVRVAGFEPALFTPSR